MYGSSSGAPPISEGEEVDVLVEAVGEKGDGIAKVKGFVVFIPDAKKGDEIRIRITKVLKNVGFGERIGEAQQSVKEVKEKPKDEGPRVEKDEKTGKETIKGESLEAEYDPSKDSEDF